ncbi:MAG: hypothetical protein JXA69_09895 [Phycisphaerae bacterium]|nr:hypothetical protein [Phycisphaerae bacterium]
MPLTIVQEDEDRQLWQFGPIELPIYRYVRRELLGPHYLHLGFEDIDEYFDIYRAKPHKPFNPGPPHGTDVDSPEITFHEDLEVEVATVPIPAHAPFAENCPFLILTPRDACKELLRPVD